MTLLRYNMPSLYIPFEDIKRIVAIDNNLLRIYVNDNNFFTGYCLTVN